MTEREKIIFVAATRCYGRFDVKDVWAMLRRHMSVRWVAKEYTYSRVYAVLELLRSDGLLLKFDNGGRGARTYWQWKEETV